MDSSSAIHAGNLSNNTKFFGSSTAEITSQSIGQGGWNSDDTSSVTSSASWTKRGGRSSTGTPCGAFNFYMQDGAAGDVNGHRTILSGY